MSEVSRQELSSPDTSPQHPWPMVPVLQTLTVLSDGEEELMEQKMGIENGFLAPPAVKPLDPLSFNLPAVLNSPAKRKVGRPITSPKTMNRTFPAVEEIRAKLEAGECYIRPRASSSSSDVWALFQEVAYKDNHFFTGIVQCKHCKFLTRYHGQITGTSHMRRHHCFSVLFPNSLPVNRKNKSSTNQSPTGSSSGSPVNLNDADSTTPRMLKKVTKQQQQKEVSTIRSLKPMDAFNSFMPAFPTLVMNGGSPPSFPGLQSLPPPHPPGAKGKRSKNNSHYASERSLIAPSPTFGTNGTTNSSASSNGPSNNSSQSMLRSFSTSFTPSGSSSPHHSMPQPSNLNVPSTVTNNLRIQNSKQDLRERLVQFCCQELVPIASVNSEAFRAILQSHLRLCTTQLHQQLLQQQQQQQQHPQLMTLTAMVSSFMNHLSHQMPDSDQLRTYLDLLYGQCRDKIRHDLNRSLETNVGGALVCDSDTEACIISVYYVDSEWHLVEAVLSVSAMVYDINQFVRRTLETYSLQDKKKLNKFTFVSHGGLFDDVSLCLSSMAHIVDKVVEEAIISTDQWLLNKKLPQLRDLFQCCHELASRYNIVLEPSFFEVEWISKYELARAIFLNRNQIAPNEESNVLNFELLAELVDLLEPFRAASFELRQCYKHPTLPHVLLYFYKLKKVLASFTTSSSLLYTLTRPPQTEPTNLSKRKSDQVNGSATINGTLKKSRRSSSADKSEQSSIHSDLDSDTASLVDEKEIDPGTEEDPFKLVNDNNEVKENFEMIESDDKLEISERFDQATKAALMVNHFKGCLAKNLESHYEVQSLHRIATFLWPNFRLLKMLTPEEQKEVHEDVRKMLQSRITVPKSNYSDGRSRSNCTSLASAKGNTDVNGHLNGCSSNAQNGSGKTDFDEWEVLSDHDQDEVDKYLSVQLTSCTEDYVLQWWREHSIEFPKLSQLAKLILSIPASVTTRERFKIGNNRQMDDLTLFLHCNLQNDKFDLSTLRKSQPKAKVKHSKSSSSSSSSSSAASLIASCTT